MKLYFPTTSLNIDNILSTESISPQIFYQNRTFGSKHFEKIPYELKDNSVCFFSKIPQFEVEDNEQEQYPLVIEFDDSDQLKLSGIHIEKAKDDIVIAISYRTVYLTPWNTRLLCFSKRAYNSSRAMIESSRNCKLGTRFIWDIVKPEVSLAKLVSLIGGQEDCAFDNFDSNINVAKGAIWGYFLGQDRSISQDIADVISINNSIRNIASNAVSNSGNCPSNFYSRLCELYSKYKAIIDEEAYIKWNGFCSKEDEQILRKYKVLEEAQQIFFEDNNIHISPSIPEQKMSKDKWIEFRELMSIKTKSFVDNNKNKVSINYSSPVFNGMNVSIPGLKLVNFVLEMISKGAVDKEMIRINRVSVMKQVLSGVSSMLKSEFGEETWKNKPQERLFINMLANNISDFQPFDIKATNNKELKAIASFLLKGEDFESLVRYLEENNTTDFSLPLLLWGAVEGYASIHKRLLFPITNAARVSEVNELINIKSNSREYPKQQTIRDDKVTEIISCIDNEPFPIQDSGSIDIFRILSSVKIGKKVLSKEIVRKVSDLFGEYGTIPNDEFYQAIKRIKGVGDGAFLAVKKALQPYENNKDVQQNVPAAEPAINREKLCFVNDNSLVDFIRSLNISDKNKENIIIDDVAYIQKTHKCDRTIDNHKCLNHLEHLLFSPRAKLYLDRTPENEKLVAFVVKKISERYQ